MGGILGIDGLKRVNLHYFPDKKNTTIETGENIRIKHGEIMRIEADSNINKTTQALVSSSVISNQEHYPKSSTINSLNIINVNNYKITKVRNQKMPILAKTNLSETISPIHPEDDILTYLRVMNKCVNPLSNPIVEKDDLDEKILSKKKPINEFINKISDQLDINTILEVLFLPIKNQIELTYININVDTRILILFIQRYLDDMKNEARKDKKQKQI
ncbi:uncharacterized protein ASCRUDRAFT_6932 [Ascoidea rubescens DSM 1968]|uniref:Uncharacterized protein n=1 Tax=Ascoidea rubescens DSM 1968 TaxID=1344418 RepID=A0A1D2VL70_9ASCO|nr:hypothetical protein ASCRUDRAFT_6932 [Ascoidea rubescens DSM 1968]ODV62334.1 hypothetical protein ASCRUDRAFT_6932 [Ascoidea rubescens DSM 1968]